MRERPHSEPFLSARGVGQLLTTKQNRLEPLPSVPKQLLLNESRNLNYAQTLDKHHACRSHGARRILGKMAYTKSLGVHGGLASRGGPSHPQLAIRQSRARGTRGGCGVRLTPNKRLGPAERAKKVTPPTRHSWKSPKRLSSPGLMISADSHPDPDRWSGHPCGIDGLLG